MTRFARRGSRSRSSVLDMEWHLVDVDPSYGSGWTGYSWNRELFPDPDEVPRLAARARPAGDPQRPPRRRGPGVRGLYPAMAEALGRDPALGDPIAFDVTDREFLTAYFNILHRSLERDGVDFWWIDWQSGSHSRIAGIDPLWMLNHFHFLDNARGRHVGRLTFSRYAGPGSHRYPVGFSGDTVVTWASLDFQPYFTATASNIGYGWWSHDIGGHMFGVQGRRARDAMGAARGVLADPAAALRAQPVQHQGAVAVRRRGAAAMTTSCGCGTGWCPYLHTHEPASRPRGGASRAADVLPVPGRPRGVRRPQPVRVRHRARWSRRSRTRAAARCSPPGSTCGCPRVCGST